MKRPIVLLASGAFVLCLVTLFSFFSSPDWHQWTPRPYSLPNHSPHTLREQLNLAFPYLSNQAESSFPSIIWQTWKTSPDAADWPEEFNPLRKSWKDLNPSAEMRLLTDADAATMVENVFKNVPDVVYAYHLLPLPILKADFFRYLILLHEGGTYTDIDTEALKPINTWTKHGARQLNTNVRIVIGVEADPDREDWRQWYARRLQFCQWTIHSKPRHPILVEVVARITELTLAMHREGRLGAAESMDEILNHTGPGIWTDAIFAYFNIAPRQGPINNNTFFNLREPKVVDDVLVLPITSFSPGMGFPGSEGTDHALAYVRHAFGGKSAMYKVQWMMTQGIRFLENENRRVKENM
ncbi:hypothetical protein B0A52_03807 [Exophiala mesophila]|uniref:Initiation-specific alpha-1,6-mannosyltransferase n=1 Tax=Exophiala mesophila TaxID=212818 RepID=A0A438N775_EXOME|nr:hypothetical protein B0A52_03807 [Exophiala mesophila]